jgi:hypothetical protein
MSADLDLLLDVGLGSIFPTIGYLRALFSQPRRSMWCGQYQWPNICDDLFTLCYGMVTKGK